MYNKYPYTSDMYLIPKTCTSTCSIFRISVCGIPIFSKNRHAPGQSRTVAGHAHAPRGFRRASQCSRNNRDATRFDSIRFDSIYEYHGEFDRGIFIVKLHLEATRRVCVASKTRFALGCFDIAVKSSSGSRAGLSSS